MKLLQQTNKSNRPTNKPVVSLKALATFTHKDQKKRQDLLSGDPVTDPGNLDTEHIV